ncbi:MAG: TROVE domain-containing protein [Chloroflexota bacterium]
MKTNRRAIVRTHEGGKAALINAERELKRSIMACLLWEDTFYESGEQIADRVRRLAAKLPLEKVAEITIEAKDKMHLRHAPLWLALAMVQRGNKAIVGETIAHVIQRADELAEIVAMYWMDGKKPLPSQLRKGLAIAFQKFDAYELAKYNRSGAIKLRDVMFLTHPKPKDDTQANTWRQLANRELPSADTWEVRLSAGKDKRESFEELLRENRLGYLALLRNLRNMANAEVDEQLVFAALRNGVGRSKILPFQFLAAARAVPRWEPQIEEAMMLALGNLHPLLGRTVLLIDVSGSMKARLSRRGELNRMDAASALGVLLREICKEVRIFTFSDEVVECPPRRGIALIDAIYRSQRHFGTLLGNAVQTAERLASGRDRLIVITDEQAHDNAGLPQGRGYIVNVASYRRGVGYGKWIHIDGWSEAIVDYIVASEAPDSPVAVPGDGKASR